MGLLRTVVHVFLMLSCLVFGMKAQDGLGQYSVNGRLIPPDVYTNEGDAPEEGTNIHLICDIRVPGINRFSWYRNGAELRGLPGAEGRVYTISQARIGRDEGWYSCTAYVDTLSSWRSPERVVQLRPKQARLEPAPRAYVEIGSNMSVTMTCSTPSVGTFVYCFKEDGNKESCSAPGNNTFTYTESGKVGDGMSSKYFTCQARNRDGMGTFVLGGSFSNRLQIVSVEKPDTTTTTS